MKNEFNLATTKVVFVVWFSLYLGFKVLGMLLFSLGWRKQLFIQFSGYMKPPPLDCHAFHIPYITYISARFVFPKSKNFCIKVAQFQKDLNHREDNSRWCQTTGVSKVDCIWFSLSHLSSVLCLGASLSKPPYSDWVYAQVRGLDNFASNECKVWSFFLHLCIFPHS